MLRESGFPGTRDDGRVVYDVRFDAGQTEYDYEILAADGQVVSSDIEQIRDDRYDDGNDNRRQNGSSADVAVSREKSNRDGSRQSARCSGK